MSISIATNEEKKETTKVEVEYNYINKDRKNDHSSFLFLIFKRK